MLRPAVIVVALLLVTNINAVAEDSSEVIDAMDELHFTVTSEKCQTQLVTGRNGSAVQFTFEAGAQSCFAAGKSRGNASWEQADGFSFWVRGDGSDQFVGLQFIWNEDYALRYDYGFWVSGNEWNKIIVPWSDLVVVTSKEGARPLSANGNSPAKLGAIWFGKWWYWRDYPEQSFAIDDIRLEDDLPITTTASPAEPSPDRLDRVRSKLRQAKPLAVVTMGDSLTDFSHWANRETNWPRLLKGTAAERYSADVRLINPAIGGTELRQNLVLIPRWSKDNPRPDLVTIWFGGNDYNAGMRGEMYYDSMCDAIERIRVATGGEAEVLVMTTCPGADAWDTYAELADAARMAAKDEGAGLADIYAAFHAVEAPKRERLFVQDRVHLSPAGHELVAETVLKAIEPRTQ